MKTVLFCFNIPKETFVAKEWKNKLYNKLLLKHLIALKNLITSIRKMVVVVA